MPVDISFVTVNRKSAPIIEKCEKFGVNYYYLSTKNINSFEDKLSGLISEKDIDLVALAGFLKKLSSEFLDKIAVPILNIHPALLPRYGGKGFYGMKVHKAVFENRDKFSGVTVHLVNSEYDKGKIIKQEKVNIEECNSAQSIADKVLKIEHKIYPRTIWEYLSRE